MLDFLLEEAAEGAFKGAVREAFPQLAPLVDAHSAAEKAQQDAQIENAVALARLLGAGNKDAADIRSVLRGIRDVGSLPGDLGEEAGKPLGRAFRDGDQNRWIPGARSSKHPYIHAGTEPNTWEADAGYHFKNNTPGDFEVVPDSPPSLPPAPPAIPEPSPTPPRDPEANLTLPLTIYSGNVDGEGFILEAYMTKTGGKGTLRIGKGATFPAEVEFRSGKMHFGVPNLTDPMVSAVLEYSDVGDFVGWRGRASKAGMQGTVPFALYRKK